MTTGLLVGKKTICAYLSISDYHFTQFITQGMPAKFHNSRWYAHKENLELYFKGVTRFKENKDHEEEE